MRNILLVLSFILSSVISYGQLLNQPFEAKRGFFSSIEYGYHFPGADLKERFGPNSAIGVDFNYKVESNWTVGLGYHWMFGRDVHDRDMFNAFLGSEGQLIDQDGQFSVIRFNQRGHHLDIHGGKIFPLGQNKNSGLLLELGVGYLWHRIDIQASTAKVPQITEDYEKGYDRLNGGVAFSQFFGYQFLDPNKRVNLRLGMNFSQAFTKSLRSYDFDIMKFNDRERTDLLSGFEIGIIIPVYTKDPNEELYFLD